MKVISTAPMRVTCPKCGALLEVEGNDWYYDIFGIRSFKCGNCKRKVKWYDLYE